MNPEGAQDRDFWRKMVNWLSSPDARERSFAAYLLAQEPAEGVTSHLRLALQSCDRSTLRRAVQQLTDDPSDWLLASYGRSIERLLDQEET